MALLHLLPYLLHRRRWWLDSIDRVWSQYHRVEACQRNDATTGAS